MNNGQIGNDFEKWKQQQTVRHSRLTARFRLAVIAALCILAVSSVAYRVLWRKMKSSLAVPVKLPMPLVSIPLTVGHWQGENVKLSETVLKIAGNDDFLSRIYTQLDKRSGVYIYVAFSGRPRYMRGHQPLVCYPNAGYQIESSRQTQVTTTGNLPIPCMVHHFKRVYPTSDNVVVLNYYIVNGKLAMDEKSFSGLGFRSPNLQGDLARYVAQIQISSQSETTVLKAAAELSDTILRFFPAIDAPSTPTALSESNPQQAN